MPLILNGTTGISGVDGSAGTPSYQGTDTNTGIFYPAADILALSTGGSERLRIDSSGSVGIAVTPSAWASANNGVIQMQRASIAGLSTNDLHASSNVYYDNTDWRYIASSLPVANYFQSSGNHVWRYANAGTAGNTVSWTEAMRIDSTGNVGIGTTTGDSLGIGGNFKFLSILGGASGLQLTSTGTNAGTVFGSLIFGGFNVTAADKVSASIRVTKDNSTVSNAAASMDFFVSNGTANTNRMTITSIGDVLIGSSTSSNLVSNQLQVGSTSNVNSGFQILNSTTGTGGVYYGDSTTGGGRYAGYIEYGHTSNAMFFATNETERMRITSGGALMVNQTTLPAAGNRFVVNNTTWGNAVAVFQKTATVSGTGFYITFQTNTADTGAISTDGSTTTYSTTSDYRLKENVAPMTGALEKVAQLKPVTYNWKATGKAGQGFIAHELQAVVPDCVTGTKDEFETVDVKDEDGNVIGQEQKPVYQGIDTSFLVATLTAAIQEQQAMIEELKQEVAALKAK